MRRGFLLGALAAIGAAAPAAAQPQATANVVASVYVAPDAPTLAPTRDLQFGFVEPGTSVSVPAVAPFIPGTWSAGVHVVRLRKNADYGLYFDLPSALVNGSTSLPVSFAGAQYGRLCVYRTAPCDALDAALSPADHASSGTAYVLNLPNSSPGNNFDGEIYLGGLLTVPASPLPPGTYTATITVTVTVLN